MDEPVLMKLDTVAVYLRMCMNDLRMCMNDLRMCMNDLRMCIKGNNIIPV